MRVLVRLARRRRRAQTARLLRPLELALGYVEPDLVERHFNPDLLSGPGDRRTRREWDLQRAYRELQLGEQRRPR